MRNRGNLLFLIPNAPYLFVILSKAIAKHTRRGEDLYPLNTQTSIALDNNVRIPIFQHYQSACEIGKTERSNRAATLLFFSVIANLAKRGVAISPSHVCHCEVSKGNRGNLLHL